MNFQAKDLKEHNEYKYRIRAFNSIGISEPANGNSFIAKNPFGKTQNIVAAILEYCS